jgi:hypothetical protein
LARIKAIFEENSMAPWRGTEPGAVVLGELEVRPALPGEMQRVATLLNEEHYLGAGRQVGRTPGQVVHHRERRAAILVWGPAAMKLIDRDEWIGWTRQQRTERFGLIGNLAVLRCGLIALKAQHASHLSWPTIFELQPQGEAGLSWVEWLES